MKMTMTNELPAEIMENGIHYTLVGDYYFPTCMLADRSPNGKWASLYERYLQEKHPHEYVRLIWADELSALLESVQKECEEEIRKAEAEAAFERKRNCIQPSNPTDRLYKSQAADRLAFLHYFA